ncbi:hypothetical protein D3C80_1397520 [compost metagenome]
MRSRFSELSCQRRRKALTCARLACSQAPQIPVRGPRVSGRLSTSNSCRVSLSISGDRAASLWSRLCSTSVSVACVPASTTGISARSSGKSSSRNAR